MKFHIVPLFLLLSLIFSCQKSQKTGTTDGYTGSKSCIDCHEKFYSLWHTSNHAKAMQEVDKRFITNASIGICQQKTFGQSSFNMEQSDSTLTMIEIQNSLQIKYPIKYALGGKYVYYFLTELDNKKLQVVPLAWDTKKRIWFNTPLSAVRHFEDSTLHDEPLDWRHPSYTFNTSCYNCHVSRLNSKFDFSSNRYQTHWNELGVNCENCHGPGQEHIKVCKPYKDSVPDGFDLKIIRPQQLSSELHNAMCASCHAKMVPIKNGFSVGDNFYDYYDLVCLESNDFYPDGAFRGENFSFTLWEMSPCVAKSDITCSHCHTPSGRYRFKGEKANNACMPCHSKQVSDISSHSHHAESNVRECISCHMLKTEFGRMEQSEHSMRPPMPAATLAFGSPNACNACHKNKSAQWADKAVRRWTTRDYQASTVFTGTLIEAARNRDWSQFDLMQKYIRSDSANHIVTTSLIRLMDQCTLSSKIPLLIYASEHRHPLVRASALEGLRYAYSKEVGTTICKSMADSIRLVRLKATGNLPGFPQSLLPQTSDAIVSGAMTEYRESILARPDHYSSFFNMGQFMERINQSDSALIWYEKSLQLWPENVPALINASMIYARNRSYRNTELYLKKAIELEPANSAALQNLALLYGETNRTSEAINSYKVLLQLDPRNAVAAYNLSVLLSSQNLADALTWAKTAMLYSPETPKYTYTYAYYLFQNGNTNDAVTTLKKSLKTFPAYSPSYFLLASIYEQDGAADKAREIYSTMVSKNLVDEESRQKALYKLQTF